MAVNYVLPLKATQHDSIKIFWGPGTSVT